MAVKGTKLCTMRVMEHNPIGRVLRRLLWLTIFLASVIASYFYGVYRMQQVQQSVVAGADEAHQQALAELTKQITLLRTNADIDRQTIDELREVVVTQKAQKMAADRDLKVYKDLLSPAAKTNPLGISFGVFTVLPQKEAGRFSYSLVVQKLSTKENDFTGTLEFKLMGKQGGKPQELSLYQVSSQVTVPNIPLSFKYFQTIEGDMTLPLDFVPQNVVLVVKTADKKNSPVVDAQLDWPVAPVKLK